MQAKTGEGEVEPNKATVKKRETLPICLLPIWCNLTASDHILSEGRVRQMDIPAQSIEEDISQVTFVAKYELGKLSLIYVCALSVYMFRSICLYSYHKINT